jgi:transcriptional regulator with XRE-family HTH domain
MRTFNNRAADVGRARARQLARWFGQELRIARVTAGLTQDRLAAIARVSQQEVSRVEAGADGPSLEIRCRLAAAAGHQVRLGIVPVASVPLRDTGQLAVAEAILRVVHPAWTATLEAQVAPGDRRAADILLAHATERVQVEIERTIVDFQAQLRSAQLKRNALAAGDPRPVRLVIAVPDTRATRRMLTALDAVMAATLAVPSRRIWHGLRTGTPLGGDGLLFVRTDRLAAHPRHAPLPG